MRKFVVILVAANFLLFLDGAIRHYPTVDEARLVPAGIIHWRLGEYDAADDVPPLARMISAIPILAATPMLAPCTDFEGQKYWTEAVGPDRASRDASRFLYHNRNQFMTPFRLARAPNFLWWALGAWVICRWAGELFGEKAGGIALALWCFGPNVLAREQTATPDLPLAALAIASTYLYARWLRAPSWGAAASAGLLLGATLLTDYAALALLPAWMVIGTAHRFSRAGDAAESHPWRRCGQVVLGSVLCIWALNSAYVLSQPRMPQGRIGVGGHGLASILPEDYRAGLANRWRDFKQDAAETSIALPPSIRGPFSWTALAAKVPLGTWALILGGAFASFATARGAPAERWAMWLIPSITIALAASPLEPILPLPAVLMLAAPFAIVGVAGLSAYLRPTSRKAGWPICALLASSVASSLMARPHYLHYLNETAGGTYGVTRPSGCTPGGDCGQDVAALGTWLGDRPEFHPVGLALRQIVDPLSLGIEYTIAPAFPPPGDDDPRIAPWCSPRGGPYPGRYAVDLFSLDTPQYGYFKEFSPIDRIGASIFVYDISREDAEAARRRLGLPPLGDGPTTTADAAGRDFLRRRYRDESGIEYNYAVLPPPGPRRPNGDPWPLILFLHGFDEREGGPRGDLYLDVTFPAAVKGRREDFPFIAVIPQGKSGIWSPGEADAEMALAILDEVKRDYDVDSHRIYLTGVSSGGSGVWALAAAQPRLWAAIVPISTAGCDPNLAREIAHLPCWCFHNLYDFKYPTAGPRAMIAALRESGGSPRYTEYFALTTDVERSSGLGSHDAWSKAYMLDELYAWLFRQAN